MGRKGEVKMRNLILVLAAAGLAACGPSAADEAANRAAADKAATAKKARAPYCFFKDAETKGWTTSTDAQGNVVVKGKAYRSDSRYQAVLGPATISGTTAEFRPTITTNSTGFAAQDNWWDVTATIPDSAAVEMVAVKCGAKTLAELAVKRKA
jgi:hypothetical protein